MIKIRLLQYVFYTRSPLDPSILSFADVSWLWMRKSISMPDLFQYRYQSIQNFRVVLCSFIFPFSFFLCPSSCSRPEANSNVFRKAKRPIRKLFRNICMHSMQRFFAIIQRRSSCCSLLEGFSNDLIVCKGRRSSLFLCGRVFLLLLNYTKLHLLSILLELDIFDGDYKSSGQAAPDAKARKAKENNSEPVLFQTSVAFYWHNRLASGQQWAKQRNQPFRRVWKVDWMVKMSKQG